MSSATPAVVLIGLDNITGLQSARILEARGIEVIGLAEDRRHFACRTRACHRVVETAISGPGLIATLRELASGFDHPPVLLPCTDRAVLDVSEHRAELEPGYRFVLPDHEVVEMLVDKARFGQFAAEQGLPIPATFVLGGRQAAVEASQALSFPAIIKPALKSAAWKAQTSAKGFIVNDPAELIERFDRVSDWAEQIIVQELVVGDATHHFTCNLYFDRDSVPRATLVTRKLRQWPPNTGTGSLGEECQNDSVLVESLRLFQAVSYRGLAYVELKQDERNGKYYIIEPNIGRPTGRSATAEAAGQQFLYTAYADAAGLTLDGNETLTRPGVKWMYVRQDFQSAAIAFRRRELTLREWIESVRGTRAFAVWSVRDPWPFICDVFQTIGKALRHSGAKGRNRVVSG